MELHKLPKTTEVKSRRLGQGHGSGRGKTAGRGTKGQKARGKVKPFFEGGALPLIKRMPFLRGRGRNKKIKAEVLAVNIVKLNKFKSGSIVDTVSIGKVLGEGSIPQSVKIIGNGELSVALKVKLPVSSGARKKIEKAGGEVIEN